MDVRRTKGEPAGSPFGIRGRRSGACRRGHAWRDVRQKLECRLPVLLADRIAIRGEAERRENLIAQVAQPSPAATVAGDGAGTGEPGRGENTISSHGESLG